MNLIKLTAEGGRRTEDYGEFNFVTVSAAIFNKSTLQSLMALIDTNLKRELGKIEKVRNFMDETWSFIQRIKVLDSSIEQSPESEDIDLIINDFAYSLAETCKRITNPGKDEQARDGIIFFMDEADNANPDLHIGYFFKVVTELLQNNGCSNVMFVVAGLPDVIEKLSTSHESSIRIFNHLTVKQLTPADRLWVIDRGIAVGNETNQDQTTITVDAKNAISTLSEGYPHFIQQFAYSAFQFNHDGEISKEDVFESALSEGGAVDEIGTRYYHSAYNEQIKSDEYREVLSIMAENANQWIKKVTSETNFLGLIIKLQMHWPP